MPIKESSKDSWKVSVLVSLVFFFVVVDDVCFVILKQAKVILEEGISLKKLPLYQQDKTAAYRMEKDLCQHDIQNK